MYTSYFRNQSFCRLVAVDSRWLQATASIIVAYLRLKQRKTFNLAAAFGYFGIAQYKLELASVLARSLFIPYLVQWSETIWDITHPALGWKSTRIGTRQLIVSTFWTILLLVTWRL